MYLNWQLPSKTYLDVFTFPYKLLNLHVQTACHVSTSLHLCGGMFLDGLIHKYIYIFHFSVAYQIDRLFSGNHMSVDLRVILMW